MPVYIEQPGFISSLHHGVMKISLVGNNGCSSCYKSLCMLRDNSLREVELPYKQHSFQVGDEVSVRMKPSTGYAAVGWLYVLPFVVMIVVLIFVLMVNGSEGIAGISALLVLAPYYGMLYLRRAFFQKQCQVEVVKR